MVIILSRNYSLYCILCFYGLLLEVLVIRVISRNLRSIERLFPVGIVDDGVNAGISFSFLLFYTIGLQYAVKLKLCAIRVKTLCFLKLFL